MRAECTRAFVIGAGPNGLAAAIALAQAGLPVEVFEAEPQPGGAARTMELTLPGFHHDFGSAVHPVAAASPFFSSLPLRGYGLEWIHSPAPLAHPFDDGTAITLERELDAAVEVFAADGKAWRGLVAPLVEHWAEFAQAILGPVLRVPRHPLRLAGFGLNALMPAALLAQRKFRSPRMQALFAGLAAHSFLALDEPVSASFGIVLGATAHIAGWPIPRGGAQAITRALIEHLSRLGGTLRTSCRVDSLASLAALPGEFDADSDLVLCDVMPRQLLRIAGERFTPPYNRALARYRQGPAAFKVDYALSQPIPWRAADCARAATVHLGGSLEEIAASEDAMRRGRCAERPFVLLAQPTLFDAGRGPEGKHIAWAYCHVPHASAFDMLPRLEAQIERFAPGFRDCVLARRVFRPADLEAMDANLVGGDIVGGAADWRQLLFRPTWRQYATPDRRIYLCSSSTPPGGGVHGMCGYHAARLALRRLKPGRGSA
jgi:phytoene dehydrogenase-like protein